MTGTGARGAASMRPRRALFWSVFGQAVAFVTNLGGSIVVARFLSPAEMGIYVIAVATLGLISAFTSLGISAYVVRERELTDELLDTAFTVNAILALSLSAVLFLVSRASVFLLGSAEAGTVLLVIAVQPSFGVLTFRPATLLQREGDFRSISMVAVAYAVVGTAVTITCAWSGLGYMSPAWGNLAASAAMLIGYCIAGSRYISYRVGLSRWREVLAFGFNIVTITGASLMSARLADIGLGRLLGLVTLGFYSRASNLANQIFDNFYGAATRIVFVHLSEEYRRSGELGRTFLRSFRIVTGILWPILFMLAILAPVVILQLYGAKWLIAADPLTILLLAQAVALFSGMNWELFVIKKETPLQTKIEVFRSILGLIVFLAGCMISLTAAAAARLCDSLIAFALYRRHVTRLSGISPKDLHKAYWEGMTLSAAAVAPVALVMVDTSWSAYTPLPYIAAAACLGAVLWFCALYWLHHPLIEEARVLLRVVSGKLSMFRSARNG